MRAGDSFEAEEVAFVYIVVEVVVKLIVLQSWLHIPRTLEQDTNNM